MTFKEFVYALLVGLITVAAGVILAIVLVNRIELNRQAVEKVRDAVHAIDVRLAVVETRVEIIQGTVKAIDDVTRRYLPLKSDPDANAMLLDKDRHIQELEDRLKALQPVNPPKKK